MSKGFWMEKNSAQVSDGGAVFNNTTRVGPKRSYQWFVDSADPELLSSKKQEVRSVNNKLSSEMSYASVNQWESTSSLQSVPNQYMDRLFGTEMARPINLTERNLSSVGTNDLSGNRMGTNSQFGVQLPPVLSVEDQEISIGYAGNRKVSVNQVKDCDNYVVTYNRGDLPTDQAFRRENEMSFVPMGQIYNKEHDNMMLMSHSCNTDNAHIRSSISHHVRGDDNATSMADMYVKANADMISFGGFPDEKDIIPVGRPLGGYDQLYQTSVISETRCENELDAPNANATTNTNYAVKPRTDSASRNKPESGTSKKEAPNSFPTNVRSLLSTRMLDGISVKYISLAREELRGTIKGLGYLCGCQSCNYAKVLNAYEFERHAGCKTKHPNNHIYFENGKTIYQIVQELRSTPETLLFDTIQTIFGAPINQKSFQIWKESFQVATRELQRIYGKDN